MRQHQPHHGPLEPQDAEELLPWYVTGRVSREEAKGIEAALKSMPDLAGKLAQVQREREAAARSAEGVEPAPPETLQRLLQQVEATRQIRVPRMEARSGPGGWFKAAWSRAAVWQAAFAAASVVILALAVRIYNPPAPNGLGVTGNINHTQGAVLLVTFRPTATSSDIGSLLSSLNARIVDGPTPEGSYSVQIPAAEDNDIAAATSALLSHSDVVAAVAPGR